MEHDYKWWRTDLKADGRELVQTIFITTDDIQADQGRPEAVVRRAGGRRPRRTNVPGSSLTVHSPAAT